jgi:protein NrfD
MDEITWGIPIAADLFLAGLGAGSLCFGVITSRKRGPGWESCSRMASVLAPLAVAAGLCLLIVDLRNRPRFWMTMTVFNWASPMSIGVWLLSAFVVVSTLFAFFAAPNVRKLFPLIRDLSFWNQSGWKNRLGIIGMLLALGISVYTGVLLSVSSVPLWRNPSLPFLFVVSAISTGFAGGAMLGMLSANGNMAGLEEPLLFLQRSYRVLLPLYLLAALAFLFSAFSGKITQNLLGWFGTVAIGIFVPLMLVMKRTGMGLFRSWLLFGCVLIGGFLLRVVVILTGQQS